MTTTVGPVNQPTMLWAQMPVILMIVFPKFLPASIPVGYSVLL